MTLINLCFHGIGRPGRTLEPGEETYWISPDVFTGILDAVGSHAGGPTPRVTLTFDDGNASDLAIALPELLRRGLRARFFPVVDRLGRPGSVDADGVRLLDAEGMTIGTHGMTHHPWRHLCGDDVTTELVAARRALEQVLDGVAVDEAALPLGRYDRLLLRQLHRLGYRRVWTSDRRPARAGAWLQPRYSVRADDTVESVVALLGHQPVLHRARAEAVGLAKRLR